MAAQLATTHTPVSALSRLLDPAHREMKRPPGSSVMSSNTLPARGRGGPVSVRPLVASLLAGAVGCGAPSGPRDDSVPGALQFTVPRTAPSDWVVASSSDRWAAGCRYSVQPIVRSGSSVKLIGARFELVSTDVAPVAYRLAGTIAVDSLATLFRTQTLASPQPGSEFYTAVEFDRRIDPRGAEAGHDARWVFTYQIGAHVDSSGFTVRCEPIMTSLYASAFYPNFTQPLTGAQVTVGRRTAVTGVAGQVLMDSLIVGRQRVLVSLPGYVSVDTVLDIDWSTRLEFRLRPVDGAAVAEWSR